MKNKLNAVDGVECHKLMKNEEIRHTKNKNVFMNTKFQIVHHTALTKNLGADLAIRTLNNV